MWQAAQGEQEQSGTGRGGEKKRKGVFAVPCREDID